MKRLSVFLVSFLLLFASVQQASAEAIFGVDTNVNVPVLGWFVDHTYVCIGSWSDCYTFPTGSNTSGGVVNVVGQATTTQAAAARARGTCCASNMYYGIDGVCHQHSNQVLAQAGKVLDGSTIRGYSYSVYLFGVSGFCLYC